MKTVTSTAFTLDLLCAGVARTVHAESWKEVLVSPLRTRSSCLVDARPREGTEGTTCGNFQACRVEPCLIDSVIEYEGRKGSLIRHIFLVARSESSVSDIIV